MNLKQHVYQVNDEWRFDVMDLDFSFTLPIVSGIRSSEHEATARADEIISREYTESYFDC